MTYLVCPECGHKYEIRMVYGIECLVLDGRPMTMPVRFQCRGGPHHDCPPNFAFFDVDRCERIEEV